MNGDRAKHCIYELNKLLGVDKEYIDFNILGEIIHDGLKDLEELLEYKEKYERLKEETDAYVLEVAQMMCDNNLDMKDANKAIKELETLKEDAELGKALRFSFEDGLRVTDYMGGLGIHTSLGDEEQVLNYWEQQTESEERND